MALTSAHHYDFRWCYLRRENKKENGRLPWTYTSHNKCSMNRRVLKHTHTLLASSSKKTAHIHVHASLGNSSHPLLFRYRSIVTTGLSRYYTAKEIFCGIVLTTRYSYSTLDTTLVFFFFCSTGVPCAAHLPSFFSSSSSTLKQQVRELGACRRVQPKR